ncbi:MAG: DUF2007 domain-containing protein [Bacteroidia bacterium]
MELKLGDNMKTVVLATLPNSIDAHMLKHQLDNENIYCFLVNQQFNDLLPMHNDILGSGVQVVIKIEDLERAREVANMNADKTLCPNCGSENIKSKSVRWNRRIALLFMALFAGTPIGNLIKDYRCLECNTEFKI